jgi:3-methyladenine DNA glycosylase AlkC
MEQIALDIDRLLRVRMPEITAEKLSGLPLKARLFAASSLLALSTPSNNIWSRVATECDTVRALGAIAIGAFGDSSASERLTLLQPFADDPHFGVREWAWIGLRDRVGEDLKTVLPELLQWAKSDSFRQRRFASEVIRPRGVWCKHLAFAKRGPEICVEIIDELMNDGAKYVQLSVGNWLNDARWTSPLWVEQYCDRWLESSPTPATAAICRRALRRQPRGLQA